mmetsp:Transcript_15666/g.41984  ORF Transcript_15666/g.41984 Transcript_15666/m.41984 type:complete len:696 (-) Transcript_15666:251-2338(-)
MEEDPHAWLEQVDDDKCIEWAKSRNAQALAELGDPHEDPLYKRILDILDSKEKITHATKTGKLYYNFWQDAEHVRGIWRRTTWEEFQKPAAEVSWETVLDVDALGAEDGASWVWHGKVLLDEGPEAEPDLCLVKLSPGGSDADEVREFSLKTRQFVPKADGGFRLPACKSQVCYFDRDTLLVGTDVGKEGDMTDSGYPNRVRMWKRGTPLEDAPVVFEGSTTDVLTYSKRYHDRGVWHEMRTRAVTFYTSEYWWERGGEWKKLDIPEDMEVSTFKDTFLLTLRSEWAVAGRVFKQGALLSVGLDAFFAGELSTITVLFEPSESESLQSQCGTLNFLILGLLSDVKTKLKVWEYRAGSWHHRGDQTGYGMESIDLRAVDEDHSDELWATVSGYIRPSSLYLASIESLLEGKLLDGLPLKALPHFFEAGDLEVQQHFTPSKDGTKIPYFQICKKGMKLDGSNKTLLYGYGGFEISLTPAYGGGRGAAWLEQGGVWVDANIRGGSEYGPQWHQCAKKSNRRKCYEDFEAVAEDLIARGVTCRQGLACRGGSNGGLLIGNMLTRRSWELFGALVCEVPLLDMRKFHKLLAGASWMGEYGDPDKDWDDFLHEYSPYHNVSDETAYPPIFFVTSTKDDRVHPAHARKMVARMLSHPTGAATTLYYENIEGGHGGAADNKQRAYMDTLKYKFCWKKLSGAQT